MTFLRTTRTVLGPLAAAAVLSLSLSACGAESDDAGAADEPTSSESVTESTEESTEEPVDGADDAEADSESDSPGLGSVPDVVAEVNGEEVTKDEFVPVYEARLQQALTQVQAGGPAPDVDALIQETADDLVDTELLAQEAEARGISVSDEDVQAELDSLAEEYEMESGDALLSALEERGTTEAQALEQVRAQVALEQLVEDEAGSVEPTEDRLRELYSEAKEQAGAAGGQQLPPFSEVRGELEQRATSEEIGKVAESLLQQLREDADITLNLE